MVCAITTPPLTAVFVLMDALSRRFVEVCSTSGRPNSPCRRRVAAAGLPRATYALGVLVRLQAVEGSSQVAAAQLIGQAAEKVYPLAQLAVGDAYQSGQGVPKSLCEAMRRYRKSADNLTPMDWQRLADCYSSGLGPLGTNQALAGNFRVQAVRLRELHRSHNMLSAPG
jgi:TPR repeat protein